MMKRCIGKAAILGSGTMGSGIAAHLANAGIPSLLLDILPRELTAQEEAKGLTLDNPLVRNRMAQENYQRFVVKAKPAALMSPDFCHLITIGNMADDLDKLKDCDWIIEAVPEKLEIKKSLLADIAPYLKPGTIISSNTSGISINAIAEALPEQLRPYWLGTHFFNPVRYMHLLELIPGKNTLPELVAFMAEFGRRVLGKGVVLCKDTPNFIANRLGASLGTDVIRIMEKYDLTISEIDAITGPAIGRAKTDTFSLYDMVGLDIGVASATVVRDNVASPEEKARFTFPPFIYQMLEQKRLGLKTKGGFYAGRDKDKQMLDWKTGAYTPLKAAEFPSLGEAVVKRSLPDKLTVLFDSEDPAGKVAWEHMKTYLLYASSLIPEISDNLYNVDRALRWGYNHDFGPFETWNGLDLTGYIRRMEAEGEAVPPWLKEMLALGINSFYKEEKGTLLCYSPQDKKFMPIPEDAREISIPSLVKGEKLVAKHQAGSLFDMGDGVLCFQMHAKNSSISQPLLEAFTRAQEELAKNWDAMVITGSGKNFCVGADLKSILPMIEEGNYRDLEDLLKVSQDIYLANKYNPKPVVVAPYGQVLGGGCEIMMQCSAIQGAAETYIGLVEVGVGLIPAGGGVKEMIMRGLDRVKGTTAFPLDFLIPGLENIALARVSTSGFEAKDLGFLKENDGISLSPDWLLTDAKTKALAMKNLNYAPPIKAPFAAPGINDLALMLIRAKSMEDAGFISEYDAVIFKKLVHIMSGGGLTKGTLITEDYLLQLEREAFMELCREQKTKDRIRHLLTTGKPLRN